MGRDDSLESGSWKTRILRGIMPTVELRAVRGVGRRDGGGIVWHSCNALRRRHYQCRADESGGVGKYRF